MMPLSWSNRLSSSFLWSLARIFALLLLCWFLFFFRLGQRELTSSHEARAAQNAATILEEGTWGLPRLINQRVELQKPPLYYWLVALIGRLQGEVDALAVRLPAALAALVCVLFLFFVGWYRGRPLAGFLSAAMLATCLHFTWLARVGRIDMPLTLSVCLALGGFYLGRCNRREGNRAGPWFLLGYLAIAVGILLKGPIAIVLPTAVTGAFLLFERITHSSTNQDRPWSPWRSTLWWGIPLVFAIAVPWFIWADMETNHQLFRVFFWYHNVERGFGGSNLSAHPWWFYGPRLVLDLMPWSLAIPVAGWYCWRRSLWREDAESRFGLIWLITILVFLSLMRFKRADYLLPAYPGAALWLGCLGERLLKERQLRIARLLPYAMGFIVAGLAIGWTIYLSRPDRGSSHRHFAAEIRRLTKQHVIFFRTEAHEVVFHVGQPLDTILEWENLDIWASSPTVTYFVMPPECARDWPRHLRKGRLEEVLRTTGSQQRPLVLLRSVVPARTIY
jgi:4-amino-4-deoxy-L-arabinose transferase-like glycosyltransferase